jgi:hypothetical protein
VALFFLASAPGCARADRRPPVAASDPGATAAAAERAVELVQARVDAIVAGCGTSPRSSAELCDGSAFVEPAAVYQARWGTASTADPAVESGTTDDLRAAGGPGLDLASVVAGVTTRCEARCDRVRERALEAFSRQAQAITWSCWHTRPMVAETCAAVARLPHPPYALVEDEVLECNRACTIYRDRFSEARAADLASPAAHPPEEQCVYDCNARCAGECGNPCDHCADDCAALFAGK